MTFNIEYGGEEVDFSSVAKAIEAADADVVAINEGYGNIPRIAADLGWSYYDVRSQVVSRLPLLTPSESDDVAISPDAKNTDGRAVLVEVAPGEVAAIINVHLPSSAYSPFAVNSGASAREVVATEERVRMPALELPLSTAQRLIPDDMPVFVLGDFNAPSHLDWTKATVGLRKQVKYPLRWPTSVAAQNIGLVDSYRTVHPDPVADPGLTWPADRPFVKGYNPAQGGQAADRIDLLFSGGPAHVTESSIVGERGSKYSDIVVSPWPTDHRAVVSEFELVPAPAPTLVSVRSRLIEHQRPLVADYRDSEGDAATLAVTAAGDSDPLVTEPLADGASGSVRVDTTTLEPGEYAVDLLDGDGDVAATEAFWVGTPDARTHLRTGKPSYRRGQAIDVSWTGAPGNRNDWLGVYRHGADPNVAYYLGWTYTGSEIAGVDPVERRDQRAGLAAADRPVHGLPARGRQLPRPCARRLLRELTQGAFALRAS